MTPITISSIEAIIASKSNIVQMSNGVVNRFFQTTTDSNNINWKHCHFDQIVADIKTQCIIPGSGVKFDLSEELKKSNLAYAKYAIFFDKIGSRLVRMKLSPFRLRNPDTYSILFHAHFPGKSNNLLNCWNEPNFRTPQILGDRAGAAEKRKLWFWILSTART